MAAANKSSIPATGTAIVGQWLAQKGLQPFAFQQATWQHIVAGKSGIVNAPTGCGKTFSVFLGAIIQYIDEHPNSWQQQKRNGLRLLWVTPLRALAKDLGRAMQEVVNELGLPWQVGIRNGDTDTSERARQKKQMPEVLIITPESLQLLLAMKGHEVFFEHLRIIAVDEWHELIGSKRGVQVELALAWLVQLQERLQKPPLQLWGISATIGNLAEASEVLLHPLGGQGVLVKAAMRKDIAIHSIIPDEIEKYPWAGHLGIKLVEKVVPIIEQSTTTLIFINTRGMAERWYQALLDVAPQLAGAIALHHGSIEQELRLWVEDALHTHKLKAVVATASLDLGVDFRPVDTVIQVGSPKGVSRFLQRAGRAGHQPGEVSNVYFLPTHSLELVEAAALKAAIEAGEMESRDPLALCFDVLCQFLCTLAVGNGFEAPQALAAVQRTWCFSSMTEEEWQQVLLHITEGGKALQQYDEYRKVEVENGIYKIKSRRLALRHRMNIGTIVSDAMMKVRMLTGGYVGHIEEWFISRLEPGDVFTLAGRNLELVQIKDMTVLVRKSNQKKSIVPSWMGGRMSLTANLGKVLRETMGQAAEMVASGSLLPLSPAQEPGVRPTNNTESPNTPSPLSLGEGPGVRPTNNTAPSLSIEDAPEPKPQPIPNQAGYMTASPAWWPYLLKHAKEMRKQPTAAEKLLWQNLRNRKLNGYKFRRQHPVLFFIPDFVCLEKKLIVELDGAIHADADRAKADFFRACLLSEHGYSIIRFWNSEIENNQMAALEKISSSLTANESVAAIQERLKNARPEWWLEYVGEREMLQDAESKALSRTPGLTPSPSPGERGASAVFHSGHPHSDEGKDTSEHAKRMHLNTEVDSPELQALTPLFQLQAELSHIPGQHELLIEHHESKEGYHLLVYPFEGRQVHEAMSAILAYRISRVVPITFSIAMNDYGFELLSDQPIPVDDTNVHDLFSTDELLTAMQHSANHVEMAMRKFRDIAVIGGLVFQGMPGEQKKARHLQASASLIFKVFKDFDPDNLLLRQAYQEVYEQQMEEVRLRTALQRILQHPIIIRWPARFTPLSFPIIADGLNRNNLSSENLEARIKKMAAALNES
ncbi:MAG: DUF559 domain-containing protein [Chitinophagaceae bacterium]|nr:DUF559 domain-containing protein [Chitinophagaceae bacterium]